MRVKIINETSYQTFPETDDMVDLDYSLLNRIGIDKQFRNGEIVDFVNIDTFRQRREVECFTVINRGQLWYDTLTVEQKVELKEWYQSWLNVTETGIVPQKPSWL